MKHAVLFLGLVSAMSTAHSKSTDLRSKKPRATLEAQLKTDYIEALKKSITLTTNDSGVWTVEIFSQCESEPCNVKDQIQRTKMKVTQIRDSRGGDGPLEIEFDNGMQLNERASGWGLDPAERKANPQPPFTLQLKIDGQDLKLPLRLQSSILTNANK